MTDSKQNKETPLRVRVTEAEHVRILQAAAKLGVPKSEYVRWALENSTSLLLGVTLKGERVGATAAPVQKPAKPKRARQSEPVVEAVAEAPPAPEPVPDVLTAFGLASNAGPQPALFDDSTWE